MSFALLVALPNVSSPAQLGLHGNPGGGGDQVSWHQPHLPVRTLRKACLFPIWACGGEETMNAVSERMEREDRGVGKEGGGWIWRKSEPWVHNSTTSHVPRNADGSPISCLCPSSQWLQTGVCGTLLPHKVYIHTSLIKIPIQILHGFKLSSGYDIVDAYEREDCAFTFSILISGFSRLKQLTIGHAKSCQTEHWITMFHNAHIFHRVNN